MNRFTLVLFLFITLTSCINKEDELIDIDGNSYVITRIGHRLWMAENLKVKRDVLGEKVNFFYPDGDSTNVQNFGLLYDFENACKVCPEGWRLPNNPEWEELFEFTKSNIASNYKDSIYWDNERNSNTSKFSIRPAGTGNNQEHPNNFNEKTLFWSSSKDEEHFIWTFILEKGNNKIRKASQHPTYAFSVRCIKKSN